MAPGAVGKHEGATTMTAMAKIQWGCNGYRVSGVPARMLRQMCGELALAHRDITVGSNRGFVIAMVALELRAHGYEVEVGVHECHLVQHACGAVYTHEAWLALPAQDVQAPSRASPSRVGRVDARLCTCGGTSTYADLTIKHDHEVITMHGGDA